MNADREDKTIEMFLRFRCLDLNTRHNHSTSLRFCFQGCLQHHFNFRAADKDHLDFLFWFHHYAFNNLSDKRIVIFHWVVLQSVKYGENLIESRFGTFSFLTHGSILFELYGQPLLFVHHCRLYGSNILIVLLSGKAESCLFIVQHPLFITFLL